MRPLGHGLDFCFSTRFSDCPDVEHWLLVTPVLTPLFSKSHFDTSHLPNWRVKGKRFVKWTVYHGSGWNASALNRQPVSEWSPCKHVCVTLQGVRRPDTSCTWRSTRASQKTVARKSNLSLISSLQVCVQVKSVLHPRPNLLYEFAWKNGRFFVMLQLLIGRHFGISYPHPSRLCCANPVTSRTYNIDIGRNDLLAMLHPDVPHRLGQKKDSTKSGSSF